jgi:hypothetical protein
MEDFLDLLCKYLTHSDNMNLAKKFLKVVRMKDGEVYLPNFEVLGRCLESDSSDIEKLLDGDTSKVNELNRHLKEPWRVVALCKETNRIVLKLDHGMLMKDCLRKILK